MTGSNLTRPAAVAGTAQGSNPRPGPRELLTVVGIGASAGGLDACRSLVAALPPGAGMAFIVIQHPDPAHAGMMVELLAAHTTMRVEQATDGMLIARDHIHVVPPGTYPSVRDGSLHLSPPQARHGARLPFDFLLHAMAAEYGSRAVCVILSGTGTDGTLGARAIREGAGLVIAQEPGEAAFDVMPRGAIAADVVDLVLPVARMPAAMRNFARHMAQAGAGAQGEADWLPRLIELLRARTQHDFTLYKQGTLRRRIARRMAMAGIEASDTERYVTLLHGDAQEVERLAKDLLINVTRFFRDPKVFDLLAERVIPAIVHRHGQDDAVRIWIAGCSTGEETYSLAMLLREHIAASRGHVKLQIIASDIDADAVAAAREGLYPDSIEHDVSPERLARFFVKEERGYRVLPDLRASVVFAVHDVLNDPPFSRLDLISCRNLLIYLRTEAQAKVISLFHFALREAGYLVLGGAESIGEPAGRFEVISKPGRVYRHIDRHRPEDVAFPVTLGEAARGAARAGKAPLASRQSLLAEICRRMVIERFAPAAVLINQRQECVFSLGPIDRFLRIVPGVPTNDLPAMARQETRIKLRSAIHQARQDGRRVVIPGGRITHDGASVGFSIDVQPFEHEDEKLLLVCFVEVAKSPPLAAGAEEETPRLTDLEAELDATRAELREAVRDLEISVEEQRAVAEEALSVNQEYQSTNEELLTSKEELQSLNEELTALNGQLHETLERQRTTGNDLQNVLYSTDVATIFLDAKLNIRFFTPTTNALFRIIDTDIGRPLADLRARADDPGLLDDARAVLESHQPRERAITAGADAWFQRRILPYRTQDNTIEGVVITFTDITDRHRAADALEAASRLAERATVAKSRFLAAASHDLRQPLQTLTLLQGLLVRMVKGERGQALVERFGTTLGAMSGMLNTLLDTNHIEAGTVTPAPMAFPIGDLLARLGEEFGTLADAHDVQLRVMPSSMTIESDPRMLEQILRNLLSNALKYTRQGKVLLGCRRHGALLRIEVWDTGVGIPADDLDVIFEEYHQLNNADRERGLGLGLSIVRRLSDLLGHRLRVRSRLGRGSVFAIEVPAAAAEAPARRAPEAAAAPLAPAETRPGSVLVVDDDADIRELLEIALRQEGHRVAVAANGAAALALIAQGGPRPDLLLLDYNLPDGMSGLQLAARLREALESDIPAIVLTGDISTEALRDISGQHCTHLNKPVLLAELNRLIRDLLPATPRPQAAAAPAPGAPVVHVVDDDPGIREALRAVLEEAGHPVQTYPTGEAFVSAFAGGREGCVLIDAYLPGMSGFDVLRWLQAGGHMLPGIMITGDSDVAMAVEAMKAGALDFIEKPVGREELLAGITLALERSRDGQRTAAWRGEAARHLAALTPRQIEIMALVLAGHPSKNIAADLRISQRTVENHRAAIMKKTATRSLPALARLVLAANGPEARAG